MKVSHSTRRGKNFTSRMLRPGEGWRLSQDKATCGMASPVWISPVCQWRWGASQQQDPAQPEKALLPHRRKTCPESRPLSIPRGQAGAGEPYQGHTQWGFMLWEGLALETSEILGSYSLKRNSVVP